MLTLFHGSFADDIKTFDPGSHFGTTVDQALTCLVAHKIFDAEYADRSDIFLYTCQPCLTKSELVSCGDWGTPNHQGALMAYLKCTGKEARWRKLYRELSDHAYDKEFDAELFSLNELSAAMSGAGHRAIEYLNTVEGSDPSFMIIDSTCILSSERRSVSWKEACIAFEKIPIENFGGGDDPAIALSKLAVLKNLGR